MPIEPNAQHHYNVTPADLPLSCPMPDMYLWNSHPRVYLPIESSGWAKCSYCGAEYTLVRGEAASAAQAASATQATQTTSAAQATTSAA